MDKHIVLDPNAFLHQSSGKVYFQELCSGWCIFIFWCSTTKWLGSIFGCFSQSSVWIKAGEFLLVYITWSKLIPAPVREGLFSGVLQLLVHPHFFGSTTMWLGSIFGCFSQSSLMIKAGKLLLVYFAWSKLVPYLQVFGGGWCILTFWCSTATWLGSIFGCFSQCSVIVKACSHG